MTDTTHQIPQLVATARDSAQSCQDRIDALRAKSATNDTTAELATAIREMEQIAVDIWTVFEARMQGHFKRGPFSRKLKALLIENRQVALAGRLHRFYLSINVLKHGTGASYRELLADELVPFVRGGPSDTQESTCLIDVTADGFFEGLCTVILEAYAFLDAR